MKKLGAAKKEPNTSKKIMNEQNKSDLSKNIVYQQYPLGNTPEQNMSANGQSEKGSTKVPDEFWKTPQQMMAEQILGQKPPVRIVQKAVKPAKKRSF